MGILLAPQSCVDDPHGTRIHGINRVSHGRLSRDHRGADKRGQEPVFNGRRTLFISKKILQPIVIAIQENCLHDAGLPYHFI